MATAAAGYGLRAVGLRQKLKAELERAKQAERLGSADREIIEATIAAGFKPGELTKDERNRFRGRTKEYLDARCGSGCQHLETRRRLC